MEENLEQIISNSSNVFSYFSSNNRFTEEKKMNVYIAALMYKLY